MKIISLLVLVSLSVCQNKLAAFENLIAGKWKIEAKFENGEVFKQEVSFSWDLDSTIVLTKTKGITNRLTNEYGERNHGVRAWDKGQKRIRFWEFDVNGGITNGIVQVDGKSIYYFYTYGESEIKESWIYRNEHLYFFKIEELKSNKIFLNTKAKRTLN